MPQHFLRNSLLEIIFYQVTELLFQEVKTISQIILQPLLNQKNHTQVFGVAVVLTMILELFQVKLTETMLQHFQRHSLLETTFSQDIELLFQEVKMISQIILLDLLKLQQSHIQEYGLMMMSTTTLVLYQDKLTEDMLQNFLKNSLKVTIFSQDTESLFQETKLAMVLKTMLIDFPRLNPSLKNHTQVSGPMTTSTTTLVHSQVKPTEVTHQNCQVNSSKETISSQATELPSQKMTTVSPLKTTPTCEIIH